MIVKYLNLTNGLEYLDEIDEYKLVRIQSTICEQKNWNKLIQDLDYNFLFDLAQGNTVEIYDTSSNKKISRALYQGVEFIRYVLLRRWFGAKPADLSPCVKGIDVSKYFEQEYQKLDRSTKKKVDYVKKFVNSNGVYIRTYCKKSLHDGNYDYFKKLLKKGNDVNG